MPTSLELGNSNLLDTIRVLQNPLADRSYFTLVAQSSGHQNFKRRLLPQPPKPYIAMSQALRDVLPIMFLIQEKKTKGLQVICTKSYIYCKVFKDNSGVLELARLPKLRPRTKHIIVCYHHFHKHVQNGLIKIFLIGTKDQTADVLTKALPWNNFQHHHHHMCGQWAYSSYHCEGVCNI